MLATLADIPFIPPRECCLLCSLRPMSAMPAMDFGYKTHALLQRACPYQKVASQPLPPIEPSHSLRYLFGLFVTGRTG